MGHRQWGMTETRVRIGVLQEARGVRIADDREARSGQGNTEPVTSRDGSFRVVVPGAARFTEHVPPASSQVRAAQPHDARIVDQVRPEEGGRGRVRELVHTDVVRTTPLPPDESVRRPFIVELNLMAGAKLSDE